MIICETYYDFNITQENVQKCQTGNFVMKMSIYVSFWIRN